MEPYRGKGEGRTPRSRQRPAGRQRDSCLNEERRLQALPPLTCRLDCRMVAKVGSAAFNGLAAAAAAAAAPPRVGEVGRLLPPKGSAAPPPATLPALAEEGCDGGCLAWEYWRST